MLRSFFCRLSCCLVALGLCQGISVEAKASDLKLLFLGDNGHHQPAVRFKELAPELKTRGLELTYTDRMEVLNPETLNQYDGLILYANIDRIEESQAQSVLEYVADGHGFIPLHCATYCWRNSPEMIDLMGAQFQRHGGRVFATEIAEPNHPIMQGFEGFESWDETYIHHKHNEENRTVLEYRIEGEQAEGRRKEPWTWVRTHGDGRVFYTAWGHDNRTFTNPGFQNLVERGIRWACGDDPAKVPDFSSRDRFVTPPMTSIPEDAAPLEYVDVGPKIPNYTPGEKWGAQGENQNLMQQPLSPEDSMEHFVTPRGMDVELYADESNFQAKPIAMTWDERGRLWICETIDYPNELGRNRDRIRICEDTDGDHVADKFTLFAENLSVPTAIVVVRSGAVVQNGTETIYLKDTDGDDVADEKTTLISNWSLGDTHGGVSNFRYGLDNWIWAMQGYNNSTPTIDGQPTQTFRMGFWRFKLSQTDPPKVTKLEFIRSTDNNTWGLGISEEGLIFGSTANHNPSVFMTIPNRYYEKVRGWGPSRLGTIADSHLFDPITENVRQVDHHGGYTAGAGHAIYTARTFPQQWWNRTSFVCGPTGHLVGTFVLRPDGANFRSTSPCNLLASDDEWSAPVMAEVGPDGAVWVIDWYNYIVQHNPTPKGFETGKGQAYESDLRDKTHGRIYRVVPETEDVQELHDYSDLSRLENDELANALTHPSFRWRLQAQRLLIERNARDVQPKLIALINDQSVDEIGLNVGAIHAVQTLDGLGLIVLDSGSKQSKEVREALQSALNHASAGVRRNALAVIPPTAEGLQLLLANRKLLEDDNSQVQLQAILTLSDLPENKDAGEIVARKTLRESDPVLLEALTSAAANHATPCLRTLAKETAQQDFPADAGTIAGRIAEHVARSEPSAEQLQSILTSLGKDSHPAFVSSVLDGLTSGLPQDYRISTDDQFDQALVRLFQEMGVATKSKLIRLASQCRTSALEPFAEEIVDSLLEIVEDPDLDDSQRVAAARDLVGFRSEDAEIATRIMEQITAQTSPELASQLFDAVRLSESRETGVATLELISGFTPQVKAKAISLLLSRPAWMKSLLNGMESGVITASDLSLEQKQTLQSFPDKKFRERAEKLLSMSGGLPSADREKVLQSLLHVTELNGDVKAGQEMFKEHCAACHQHGELGKQLGPNLTGMAVHPKEELLTHILDPSRSVEGNFRMYTVLTIDGRIINGMLAGESRTSLTLVDSNAKEYQLAREDIEHLQASQKSIMPVGFEKQMSEKELADLLEFLTDKGKFIPLPLDKYATVASTRALFGNSSDENSPDRMVFSNWKPKMFNKVPFVLTDPQGKSRANMIMLRGPLGTLPPRMPEKVELPCNSSAEAIHLLGGVGGYSFPFDRNRTVSMIVRLNYADGTSEDHELINGVHIADYIRRVDVPKSEFAFALRNQQLRYLSVEPRREEKIKTIELIKGDDRSAPMVMAVTIETP